MKSHYYFLKRCYDLSIDGQAKVSPNPMVGAVIVHNNLILGEGFHANYGGPHAEVNAFNSVKPEDLKFLKVATLYVSLEPCNFYGKTPPCSELILKSLIKNVTISDIDFTKEVNGNSLIYLKQKGINIVLNKITLPEFSATRFRNIFVVHQRPYIVLKFAESSDGFIGASSSRSILSNEMSNRFVHLLRSKCDAILIGKNTAILDEPSLNTRLVPGRSPIKILIDPQLQVPRDNNFYKSGGKIIVFNVIRNQHENNIEYIKIENPSKFVHEAMKSLFVRNIGILLVEGGSFTLQEFINNQCYDEIYKIVTQKVLGSGVQSPTIPDTFKLIHQFRDDNIYKSFTNNLSNC